MEIMGITSVAAISVICCLLATALKSSPMPNQWLPTFCGTLGGILGAVMFFAAPDFPAGDILTAVAVGIVSGLAATGGYEAVHQIKKCACEEEKK